MVAIPITYRTDGDWGAGKGSNLTPAEVDANFAAVVQGINEVEEEQENPVGIATIETDDNGALIITLTDSTIHGPFVLPTAQFTWRDTWLNNTVYNRNDYIRTDTGLYMVLQQHTTGAPPETFNPGLEIGGEPVYQHIFGTPEPAVYHLALNYLGAIPGDDTPIFFHLPVAAFTLPVNLTGSRFNLIEAPSGNIVLPILRNGVSIGSINFAAGNTVGTVTFAASVDFSATDVLSILSPSVEDGAADTLIATIVANIQP